MNEAALRAAMLEAWRRHEAECFLTGLERGSWPKLERLPPLPRVWREAEREVPGVPVVGYTVIVRYVPMPDGGAA